MPDTGLGGIKATFDHVAHATRSIRSLLPIYRDFLGGEFAGGGANSRAGFVTVQLVYAGGGRIELLEETASSGFLESFFRRIGDGGLHHVTYRVPDIDEALRVARGAGLEPFGVNTESPLWKEFFLHPRSAGGALVQLAEAGYEQHDNRRPSMSIEEFLDDPVDYLMDGAAEGREEMLGRPPARDRSAGPMSS